ncbi:protein of unknown function (plasmid) [Caballeronia sp. S22]
MKRDRHAFEQALADRKQNCHSPERNADRIDAKSSYPSLGKQPNLAKINPDLKRGRLVRLVRLALQIGEVGLLRHPRFPVAALNEVGVYRPAAPAQLTLVFNLSFLLGLRRKNVLVMRSLFALIRVRVPVDRCGRALGAICCEQSPNSPLSFWARRPRCPGALILPRDQPWVSVSARGSVDTCGFKAMTIHAGPALPVDRC